MSNHEKNLNHGISLMEAVDTLSAIADLDLNKKLEDEAFTEKLQKVTSYGGQIDIPAVKEIFKTILTHLKNLYVDESNYVNDEKKNERVKTIMILVGEAATKLDKMTDVFHLKTKSIHDLKEYKQLQEFYITRIAKKIDEGMLGRWILGIQGRQELELSKREGSPKNLHANHVFIDLEGVKKDSEYELFFIRKEDGTRFFNPKLIRSIKLVCDFGSYFKGDRRDDPFADIQLLIDRSFHVSAKNMVNQLNPAMHRFYHEAATHQHNEMVLILHKAFIALMLCANSKNLLRNDPIKSCLEYFSDFQFFLRSALSTREYQRLLAYPEQKTNTLNTCLIDTMQTLMYAFYLSKPGLADMISFIENLIHEAVHEQSSEHEEAAKKSKQLWNHLASDYAAMSKLMRRHPSGHLQKILKLVEEGNYKFFDPLIQHNIPMELMHLYCNDLKIINMRTAAPVYQEQIQKVMITEEFKTFVKSLAQREDKLLMINYQDRTSWREHARAKALEDMQNNPEFKNCLSVVTLAKDTEFYNQDAPYDKDNRASDFIMHFREHLKDESSGFYFPKEIFKKILGSFTDETMKIVHNYFFQSKNVLTKDQRLDFIEIFYFFLELKILSCLKPNIISLTCKDGVDISSAENLKVTAFLTILNQEKYSENDLELMNLMIYGAPLMVRERLMLPDRFGRVLSAIKVFESVKADMGNQVFAKVIKEAFSLLYEMPVLDMKALPLRT